MNKKTAFLLIVLCLAVVFLYQKLQVNNEEEKTTDEIKLSGSRQEGVYKYAFMKIDKSEKIELMDNTKEKSTFDEIVKSEECKKLVSGGFYKNVGEENVLIGLFKNNGKTINNYESNVLFNGILNISQDSKASISDYEDSNSLISLQVGPVVVKNESVYSDFDDEKHSRRIIAAVDVDKNLYFVVIYDVSNTFSGPTLGELGFEVKKISDENSMKIVSAINLDGGSASFYFDKDLSLNETKFAGSYFCIN